MTLQLKTAIMKQLRFLLMMLPFLFITGIASAQKREISGKVTDQVTGEPLAGVSIISGKEKGGTATKQDGTYTISVGPGIKSLTFSFISYTPQTISIGESNTINVSLATEAITQSEVVVIGYGTQKRSNVSGAVSKYKNERIDEAPVSRLDQALQGKIAGVTVQNISSEAGADPKISIRGTNSINAGATPLVVVDGQITPDGLAFLNPGDVESVEVLKDAASAAIYGSRGSSGVIMVTTKKGVADKPKYNFKYSIGQKQDYKRYDVMTTSEYVSMLFIEMINKRSDPTVNQATNTVSTGDRASYVLENQLLGKGTDWQEESLRSGMFQNIQLGVSGGSKSVKYYFSGGYQGDEGMMYKSDYKKLNIRAKTDVEFSKRVKLTINLNPSYARRTSPSQNFTNFWRMPGWLPVYHTEVTAALARTNPLNATIKAGDYAHQRHFSSLTYTGTMPDGTPWTGSGNPGGSAQQNPKSEVDRSDISTQEYRLQSSAELNITVAKGLTFKSLASGYINYSNGLDYSQRSANRDGDLNVGIFTNNSNIYLLSENTLNYVKTVRDHDISALFGITTERTDIVREQTTGLDFPSDDIRTLASAAQVDKNRTFGTKAQIGLNSFLGRLTYAYKSKYLFSTSLRRDGSSYFGPGNKWGTFPAVSVGWAASKEQFLSNIKWLSNLKFRGSYGATGNNRIVADAWLDLLYGSNYPFGTATGTSYPGLINSGSIIANPDITWERTFQSNFGVDLALFKNKISLTLDIYDSKTEKLLLQQSVMGFTGVQRYWNNLGSLNNKGFELELSTKNIQTKNFRWTTSANLSQNKNEIIELGTEAFLLNQGERSEVYRNQVGRPLVEFLGFKTDGVWLSQAQIDDARAKGLTSTLPAIFTPGGLKVVDVNGDNKLDNNDRTILGNPYPDFIWGITNNVSYKGFELSFFLQGSHGGQLINGDPNYNESGRYMRIYNTNRWVSAGFPGDGKTPVSRGTGFNWMLTDYVVEDASYWSLREVNISYAIKAERIKKLGLSGMRFYVSVQNLYFHMADNYRSLNPEGRFQNGPYSSVLIDGYQRGSFPIPRTFLFGLDINF
jgi:TonB-linked SusC/RagA family outer membrane protein